MLSRQGNINSIWANNISKEPCIIGMIDCMLSMLSIQKSSPGGLPFLGISIQLLRHLLHHVLLWVVLLIGLLHPPGRCWWVWVHVLRGPRVLRGSRILPFLLLQLPGL